MASRIPSLGVRCFGDELVLRTLKKELLSLLFCFYLNHDAVVEQLAAEVNASAVDELSRTLRRAAKVLDTRFIVNVTERVEPRLDALGGVKKQTFAADIQRH